MVQRLITDMTLGEQEKLRLLLVTLFSFPYLVGTQEWQALARSGDINMDSYLRVMKTAEWDRNCCIKRRDIARTMNQNHYNEDVRKENVERVDKNHSLEDIVYIRNTPYVALILKMVMEGYLSRTDYPFILKPPRNYDVLDHPRKAKLDPDTLADYTPNQHRRLFLVVIGGLSYCELHHLRSLSKQMKQTLIVVTTSLSNPQSFVHVLSEIE